jgi:hypothetical protein
VCAGPTPAVREGAAALEIVRLGGRFHVLASGRAPVACADHASLVAHAEFVLTELLLEQAGHLAHLHASGAALNGHAVLALGPSGAGKSSLALAWHRLGLPVYGDDVVLVDQDGRARAFPRLFKVEPLVVTDLGIELGATPYHGLGPGPAWFDPAVGAGWADPAAVAVLAFARYEAGAGVRTRDLRRSEALRLVLPALMQSGLTAADAFDRLVRMVRGARAVEVRFGSAAAAAAALAEAAT